MKFWINKIIHPAVYTTLPSDIIARHPTSFLSAKFIASVKNEAFTESQGAQMDIHYPIPARYANAFWEKVVELCDDTAGQTLDFSEPLLVVSGHGLKAHFKEDTLRLAASNYIRHLDNCFTFTEENFPPDDCWVDIGMDVMPVPRSIANPDRPALTLLWKPKCLDEWAKSFECPRDTRGRTKKSTYNWGLTQDAGSISVETSKTNLWRSGGGVAYSKAYNMNMQIFHTPLKGHTAFDNPDLHALGFSQSLIDDWYRKNSPTSGATRPQLRKGLLKVYKHTKAMLVSRLGDSDNVDYGVRQESRINIKTLRHIANGTARLVTTSSEIIQS